MINIKSKFSVNNFFLFFLIVFLFPCNVKSQSYSGYIYSTDENAPLEFATVAIQQVQDSSIIAGVLTDSSGKFSFSTKLVTFFLFVSYSGFEEHRSLISIEDKFTPIDTVFLEVKINELSEITVNAEYIKGKEEIDRTVYRIPDIVAETSFNGFDILKKIPNIQVDYNNNIQLNGSNNFIINVDGKIRNQEFVGKLLPSDIKSIEIIDDPSGKYDGNIDGVINIILNKNRQYGLSGNLQLVKKANWDIDRATIWSIDYGIKKVSLYTTGNSFTQALNSKSTNYYEYFDNNKTNTITKSEGLGKLEFKRSSINTGLDYYINDKNTININYSYSPFSQNLKLNNTGSFNYLDSVEYKIVNPTNNYLDNSTNVLSLFYQKKYEKPIQELTIELSYERQKIVMDNDNLRYYYLLNSDLISSSDYFENEENSSQLYAYKIDYVYPLNMASKIELGYQGLYQINGYNYEDRIEAYKPFDYKENRNAIYSSLSLKKGKWSGMASIRLEYTLSKINNTDEVNYFCALPSIYIQYKINKKHNLKAVFNRRINRPVIQDLNPYLKTSDFQFSQGNPYLKPEYFDKYQIKYSLNINSNFISCNLYHTKMRNRIGTSYKYVNSQATNESTIVSYPDNIFAGYKNGLGLNAALKFLNINANIYEVCYDGNAIENIETQKYLTFNLKGYLYCNLPYKVKGFAYFNYEGVDINMQSKTFNAPFYGFGARKTIKNHTLGMFYLLPFSKYVTVNKTELNTKDYNSTTSFSVDFSGFIQLMYSYRFNIGNSVKKLHKKINVDNDIKIKGLNSNELY